MSPDSPQRLLESSENFFRKKRYPDARDTALQALSAAEAAWGKEDSRALRARGWLASVLWEVGEFEKSDDVLFSLRESAQTGYFQAAELGKALLARGEYKAAENHLARALRIGPKSADLYAQIGRSQNGQGRFSDAARSFQYAVDIAPDNYWLRMERAKNLLLAGDGPAARRAFQDAKRFAQASEAHYIEEGYAYLDVGKNKDAEISFTHIAEADSPISRHHLGFFHRLRYDYDKAEAHLSAALKRLRERRAAPFDIAHSMEHLAGLYLEQGRYEEAETLGRETLALRRANGLLYADIIGLYNIIADAAALQGKIEDAEKIYRSALSEIDYSRKIKAELYLGLARLASESGGASNAVTNVEHALSFRRNGNIAASAVEEARFLWDAANILETANYPERAETLYLESLDIQKKLPPYPELVHTLMGLARVRKNRNDFPSAAKYLRRASRAAQDADVSVRTRAFLEADRALAELRLGNKPAAEKHLDRAILSAGQYEKSIGRIEPYLAAQLASLMMNLGRVRRAEEEFRRILASPRLTPSEKQMTLRTRREFHDERKNAPESTRSRTDSR